VNRMEIQILLRQPQHFLHFRHQAV
jgi:hypothetical protein